MRAKILAYSDDFGGDPVVLLRGVAPEPAHAVAKYLSEFADLPCLQSAPAQPWRGRWLVRLLLGTVTALLMMDGLFCGMGMIEGDQSQARYESYEDGRAFLREELALKSAGVRACASRLGHLPTALTECKAELSSTNAWVDWMGEQKEVQPNTLRHTTLSSYHQQTFYEDLRAPEGESSHPPWLDALGLPISYYPGASGIDGLDKQIWFPSQDPLPSSVQEYLQSSNTYLPDNVPPFTLGSVPVEVLYSRKKAADMKAMVWILTLLSCAAAFAATALSLILRYRGGQGKWLVVAFSIVLLILASIFPGMIMFSPVYRCSHSYPALFYLSKAERLQMLGQILPRHSISLEQKEQSRRCIEALPVE